ncbi:hypothetical protein L6452_13578 [Arctium lappa]|uniref:Uncharacterized protein n=1 Tax=Arctium lappa TaxID=4217 RepID=A0ACB9CIQ1_ARCLA|nr:hypothetical protein L6452_13578 [Arctium lappa]
MLSDRPEYDYLHPLPRALSRVRFYLLAPKNVAYKQSKREGFTNQFPLSLVASRIPGIPFIYAPLNQVYTPEDSYAPLNPQVEHIVVLKVLEEEDTNVSYWIMVDVGLYGGSFD